MPLLLLLLLLLLLCHNRAKLPVFNSGDSDRRGLSQVNWQGIESCCELSVRITSEPVSQRAISGRRDQLLKSDEKVNT